MPTTLDHRNIQPWIVATLGLVVLTGSVGHAQTPAGKGAVVRLNFRAVAENGQPILDLKREDVTLRVDGKVRELRSFQLVQQGGPKAAGDQAMTALPQPFASNSYTDVGRDVLILVDDDSIVPGREQPLRDATTQLMSGLSPQDRVGLLSMRQGGVNIRATTDRSSVRAALTSMVGFGSTRETDVDRCNRTRVTLQTLVGVLNLLSGDPPVTIVFISAALAGPDSQRTAQIGQSSGLCQLRTEEFQEITKAASRSNTHFYVVHMIDGASPDANQSTLAAGLEHLAGVMGSEMFRLTGNVTDAMTRVAAETSAYYLVSFEPESSERNGSSRRIELRVNRPALKVRVQPELTIAKADNRSPTPRDMLRVASVYRDLPLRVTANGLRNPEDDQVKLIALFQPVETGTSLRAAAIGLFDEKGKLVRQWTAQDSDLKSPLVTAALTAPPGAYRLRVAAVDGSGRAGTTDYEFRAEIVRADPLTMSSLILGVPQEGSFAPRLIYGPGDQAAVGMVEIYNAPKGGNVAATIELLPSEDGAAIATTDANVQQGGTEDFRIAFGGFGIDALPPGDVLMRFTVTLDGKPVGKVTRTLRKTGQ